MTPCSIVALCAGNQFKSLELDRMLTVFIERDAIDKIETYASRVF